MTDNDARSFIFGSNSPLILPGRTVAAKTGTTQEWRDGWTLGFTPSLAAGVWVGNNDFSKMRAGADGVIVAAPIWNQFMREALKDTPPELFIEPPGIQHILVDSISGKLPTEYTTATKSEVFADFALPNTFDDVHVTLNINKYNGKLANSLTPADALETRVYTVLHSEMPNNPDWEVPVVFWAQANGYSYPTEQDDGSTNPSFNNPTINFITPIENQEISNLPLMVQLSVSGDVPLSVELSLNSVFIGSTNTPPYSFEIKQAPNGWSVLSAKAKMSNGNTIQKNILINVKVKK